MKNYRFWIALMVFLACLSRPNEISSTDTIAYQTISDEMTNDEAINLRPSSASPRHHRLQYCAVGDPRAEVVMVQQLGDDQCVRGADLGQRCERNLGRSRVPRQLPTQAQPRGWTWMVEFRPGASRETCPSSGACFFKNVNFSGEYFCRDRGSNIGQVALDDEISSIQIYGHARVTIYKDPGFNGPQATTDRSIPDLHQWRMPNSPNLNWDNRISSARIDAERGCAGIGAQQPTCSERVKPYIKTRRHALRMDPTLGVFLPTPLAGAIRGGAPSRKAELVCPDERRLGMGRFSRTTSNTGKEMRYPRALYAEIQ